MTLGANNYRVIVWFALFIFLVLGWKPTPAAEDDDPDRSVYLPVVVKDIRDMLEIAGGVWFENEVQGTGFLWNPTTAFGTISYVDIWGPGGWNGGNPVRCYLNQPPGMAANRSACWNLVLPVDGQYRARATVGTKIVEETFNIDANNYLIPPEITDLQASPGQVTIAWTAPSTAKSFWVRVNPVPFTGTINEEMVVAGDKRSATLSSLSLVPGSQYQAVVWGFSKDLKTPGPLINPFNLSSDGIFFVVP